MKRHSVRMVMLVAIVLVLGVGATAGLSHASPSARAASSPSPSAAATSTPPAPSSAVGGPSSSPSGKMSAYVGRTFAEKAPAATTGLQAPTFDWNRSLRYLGNVFKPRENDVSYAVANDGGCVHVTTGDVTEVWNVPLGLPEGAQVQYLRMYYYDNDPTNAMFGWFTKYDLYGQIVDEWSIASTNGGYNYRDVALPPGETVDYSQYAYVINWQPNAAGANMQLCGFRVFFYQPSASYLPMVGK